MEFAREIWRHDPDSAWLVKTADDHVHAGVIRRADDQAVEVLAAGTITQIGTHQVEWIRPLITAEAGGWLVTAGFQAEDHTFDTWWSRGRVLYRIVYSGPTGFSALVHLIAPHDHPELVDPPSPEVRAQARPQIARALEERRDQHVPPIDHLQ